MLELCPASVTVTSQLLAPSPASQIMERNAEQLSRDLIRAEKSLLFMQKEHQNTLSGLHEEIAHLTQKCSGLQISLSLLT